jgi:hypothetical protein
MIAIPTASQDMSRRVGTQPLPYAYRGPCLPVNATTQSPVQLEIVPVDYYSLSQTDPILSTRAFDFRWGRARRLLTEEFAKGLIYVALMHRLLLSEAFTVHCSSRHAVIKFA